MLQPKKTKFRKAHKGRIKGNAKGGTTLTFGSYGLKALTAGWVTARQIEAARISITRSLEKSVECGFEFFLIILYQKSLQKLEWVKVKVLQNIGLQSKARKNYV